MVIFMLFMNFMVKKNFQPVGWARFLCPPLADMVGIAALLPTIQRSTIIDNVNFD